MSRWILIIPLMIISVLVVGVLVTRAQATLPPEQPIEYSHRTHIDVGIQCLYCHPNALRSPVAGIPSVQKCMGCHDVMTVDDNQNSELAGYWERGEPIPWVKVNNQPDFVYFSHQPHMGAGINCETCHGNVGQMDTAIPSVKMDMGWCLECHLTQKEEKIARLVDCLACHK